MENKKAIILKSGEGKEIKVGDSRLFFKLLSQTTDDRFFNN